jgi:PIN domain nuclease of toxin-antitoxin system
MAGTRYLLDTHSLIWFQENNPKIPEQVMTSIRKPDNVILFGQISLFEISIKKKVGKLPAFYATVEEVYQQALNDGFTFLPIQNQHIYSYNKVRLIEDHRDPFDRLLIATAFEENAIILSADEKLSLYADLVTVYW